MTIPILIKLQTFLTLAPGWSYGEGGPISTQVVDRPQRLIFASMRCGFDKFDAFPGLNGELAVSIYAGSGYLELLLESDDTLTFVHEINGEEISYLEGLSDAEAIAQINNYKEKAKTCAIYDYFAKNTMTPRWEDLLVLHLSRLATAESQFSISSALKRPVARAVNTFLISMPRSPDRPLFTGSSGPMFFHTSAV